MNEDEALNSDHSLIEKIRNGETSSYRILVNRYSPMVFHIVRRYEKDEQEVAELAQQIFVKVYEKLNRYDGKSAWSTWLYRVAMNHCLDHVKNIRRGNQRISELGEEVVESALKDERTPFHNLELSEWRVLIDDAIEKLSADYSEPFLWKYRDGLSYKAMSEQTGMSVSALKVRVHRARKELKSELEKITER